MKAFMSIQPSELMISPNAKVLKADEYATFLTAGEILENARKEAQVIIQEAQAEAEAAALETHPAPPVFARLC